ncbi:MAG: AAA family ATPase [Candidatus Cloacimonetes bacterium]|nr:AAA family ATPase [Candidatus Cloacimonadota bacterium]
MLVEFSVSNYRSIKDEVTLSFEATSDKTLEDYYVINLPEHKLHLLRVGMLYGPNASGKTNILRALELVRSVVLETPNRDKALAHTPFLFSDNTKKSPGHFRVVFIADKTKYIYDIVLTNKYIVSEELTYYPRTQPALVFRRDYDSQSEIPKIELGKTIRTNQAERDKIKVSTLPNRSVLSAISEANIEVPQLEAAYNWFRLHTMPAIYPKEQGLHHFTTQLIIDSEKVSEYILDQLRKADFHISNLRTKEHILEGLALEIYRQQAPEHVRDIKQPKFDEILLLHESGEVSGELPFDDESAGTQRYFSLSGPVFECLRLNTLLYIDEIESSLHPELVKFLLVDFLKRSKEQNSQAQLLFTTHNTSLLMEKDILRRDAVWFTDKKEDGSTELFSMADFNLKKENSYFNAYRTGKLGALPIVEF